MSNDKIDWDNNYRYALTISQLSLCYALSLCICSISTLSDDDVDNKTRVSRTVDEFFHNNLTSHVF